MAEQKIKILNLYAGIGGNRKLLRNCTEPKTGLYIFNCAFKEKQITLKEEI